MHASAILRRCLSDVLATMHAARARRLLTAVDALVCGRRLTLTDLARSWPGAEWMHAPLKALDRLLGNSHLLSEIVPLHRSMAPWLLERSASPVVLVDWSDLERDGRWALLRASVPIGGRALTVFEKVFARERMGQPKAQREFLQALARVVPPKVKPIIVTDAGFRSDWFRAVRALGWQFIGRLRNNTHVRPTGHPRWRGCSSLHASATSKPTELGSFSIVKGNPLRCRLVQVRRARKGRDQLTRRGLPQQSGLAIKARKAAREPWLLVTSLSALDWRAHQVVTCYSKRMQIEESFRDLKSHRYGVGFEDSLTRKAERLTVLLMLNTLASLAAWLTGMAARATDHPDPLTRQASQRGRYSTIRRGMAWLRRTTLPPDIVQRLARMMRTPHAATAGFNL
jgi:hypothetical protein